VFILFVIGLCSSISNRKFVQKMRGQDAQMTKKMKCGHYWNCIVEDAVLGNVAACSECWYFGRREAAYIDESQSITAPTSSKSQVLPAIIVLAAIVFALTCFYLCR